MRLTEYQDIHTLHVGRLPNRATLIPFGTPSQALTGQRKASPYYLDLNGRWDFCWFESVEDLPEDVFADLSFSSIQVPGCWQKES